MIGLTLLCAGYLFGYRRGHRVTFYNQTVFDLRHNLMLYRLVKAGDTNRLEGKIRFSIFAYSDYYDRNFGDEKVASKYLSNALVEARIIASQERTNVVLFTKETLVRKINEMIQTNTATK
jgi:hypothetical protein